MNIKIVSYVFAICLALIVLICLEGIMSLGAAFRFELYNWFGWLVQAILVTGSVCGGILATNDLLKRPVNK